MCIGMHGTHNIFQVSFFKLRFKKTLLTPQKLLNFYYAKKLAVISFWPSMWADRMQNIAHQASSTEHYLFLQHFEDWFKKEYSFEILSSPWWSTTKYQMTANRSQEMKKEAAKEQRVRDQDMSIIDMKKSFGYLQIPRNQIANISPHQLKMNMLFVHIWWALRLILRSICICSDE